MKRLTLIYDGQCPLCRQAAAWALQHARPGAIEAVPCQGGERQRRFPGIALEQCMAAMHVVTSDGRVYAGDAALPPLMDCLRGWGWLAKALRWPGVRHISPAVYRWVARNRHALTALTGHRCDEACRSDSDDLPNERERRE